ncbi:MAG: hypothetical protein L3J21_01960 [Devosiaceae bacterium]|nr:hypothetical protein [Devosiaceae bacterium]
MLASKSLAPNEDTCPINETELISLSSEAPSHAVAVVSGLPEMQKARICKFCYGKTHLHELALHIASTCDQKTLVTVFGEAGRVIYKQSRDTKSTLKSLNASENSMGPKPVLLAGGLKKSQ